MTDQLREGSPFASAPDVMPRTRAFDFGRVMGRSFSAAWKAALPILGFSVLASLAAAAIVIPAIGLSIKAGGLSDAGVGIIFGLSLLLAYVTAFLSIHIFAVLTTHERTQGRKLPFVSALRPTLKAFLPMFALTVIFAVGFLLGYALLIVPGLILAAGWAVAGPAYLLEEDVTIGGSFARSWRLTEGSKWWVFLTQLVISVVAQLAATFASVIVTLVLSIPLVAPGSSQTDTLSPAGVLLQLLPMLSLVFGVAIYLGLVSSSAVAVYLECRILKEGGDPKATAEIFA